MSWYKFKSQVKTRGLARTNRYRVIIPFPTTDASGIELAELFCESVNIPGTNIATTPQRLFGEVRELPYEKIYDPVSMTFYVDTRMIMKNAFDRWINLVIDPERRTVQYYNDYIRDIEIYVIAVDEQIPYKITLFEAYPKTIGSINLSSESKEIMKLPITFQYKYWKAESTQLSAIDIGSTGSIVAQYGGGSGISPGRSGIFVGPPVPSFLTFGADDYQRLLARAEYEGTASYIQY